MLTKNKITSLIFCTLCTLSAAAQSRKSDEGIKKVIAADSAQLATDTAKKRTYLSFGPASFDFNLDRGKTGKQNFYIVNRKSKPYQINLTVKDFTRDSSGNIIFYEPGTIKNSCANWITLDKTYIEVGAGKVGNIGVTVSVPDSINTDEMKWAMIVAEMPRENLPPHQSGNITTVIENAIKVGSHVYVNFPGMTKDLKMLSFKPVNDTTYRIMVKNQGGAQIRCNMSIELSSHATGEKKTFLEDDVPLFPKQVRQLDFKLPKGSVPSGRYTLVALADALDDDIPLEAAQVEIEIK
ncbi:MAG TPA: hypothetical protein VGD89_11315 [Flavipsychrobacter sp.]